MNPIKSALLTGKTVFLNNDYCYNEYITFTAVTDEFIKDHYKGTITLIDDTNCFVTKITNKGIHYTKWILDNNIKGIIKYSDCSLEMVDRTKM